MNGVLTPTSFQNSFRSPLPAKKNEDNSVREQENAQVEIDLDEEFATNRVTTIESVAEPTGVNNNTEPANPEPVSHQPFWGLQRSISDIENQLNRARWKNYSLPATQKQQLHHDINVYRNRLKEDQVRDITRSQRHDEISQQNQRARLAAETTNKLLFNGNRDLHFISSDEFTHLDHSQHKDTYYITAENQTPVLRYIDQSGTPGVIDIHDAHKQRQLADKIQEKWQSAGNPDFVTLEQDEFTSLITDASIVNNDPATGHYNTSLAAQNLKSERILDAEYATYRETIARRFKEREAGAAKMNWLEHQGSRNFYIYDAADARDINLKAMEGDYILYKDVLTEPFPYKLFVVEKGALHPIAVPASNQRSFDEMISNHAHTAQSIYSGEVPQFTLDQEEFETIICKHTMRDNLPETAHFSSSRVNQKRYKDLNRNSNFQHRWSQIDRTLQATTKAVNMTNALQSSGARTIQVVAQPGVTSIIPAEHPDEYFITQDGDGTGRRFALYYVDPGGKIGKVAIHNEKAFNSSLQGLIDEATPPAAIELDHENFVNIVTNNSFNKVEGDWLSDRFVEDAHFSTSVEAQRLKSARMESVTGSIIARTVAETYKKWDDAIATHWNNREYGTAIFNRVEYGISKACMTVVDDSAELLGDLSRDMTELGGDIVSAIARSAKSTAPYLAAGTSYIGYGLERGASVVSRMFSVPAEYICSQFARAARWATPDLHYAKDRVGYGMSRLGDKVTRTISGTASALCQQVARAFRWASPYFSEPASWARFYMANAAGDAYLSIARGWHDKSLIQYINRARAEKNLFGNADQNGTPAMGAADSRLSKIQSFRL